MWICPKCGREFKNTNQSHYCGDKPKTIDEYIQGWEPEKQEALTSVRNIFQKALPEAEERISWSMPTYWKKRNIIHFAANAKHIGIYPGPDAVEAFADELADHGISTDKGTIRIPYDKIDPDLITRIARWCWDQAGK